jgi:polysaccharide export outer membrane protein
MREARLLLAVVAALAVGACARQQPAYYIVDPANGQLVPVVTQPQYAQQTYQQPAAQPQAAASSGERGLFTSQQSYAQPQYVQPPQQYAPQTYQQPVAQPQASPSGPRGLYSSSPAYAQQSYAQPQYAQQPQYAPQTYQQPAPSPQSAPSSGRGLFNSRQSAPQVYAQPYGQQPYVAPPQGGPQGGPYVTAPYGYASAPASYEPPYTLDSGDKLRIVVFGQDGISNSYTVDAGGNVNLPLVGIVPARGFATQQLAQMISERLKQGYVREPHVSVEIEAYRPFFILGEVTNPGQYPYVANMTAETAIAIAGGFAPRANKSTVALTRNAPGQQIRGDVPLGYPLRPGDTIVVKERWF